MYVVSNRWPHGVIRAEVEANLADADTQPTSNVATVPHTQNGIEVVRLAAVLAVDQQTTGVGLHRVEEDRDGRIQSCCFPNQALKKQQVVRD